MVLTLIFLSCNKEEVPTVEEKQLPYTVSGQVVDELGVGIEGITVSYYLPEATQTNANGDWTLTNLQGIETIAPISSVHTFTPVSIQVDGPEADLIFIADRTVTDKEQLVFNWFEQQQLANGLLESVEDGNIVSLFDNALSALVFMMRGDFEKAEKIFDFFNARINSELLVGPGGFSQFRDRNGVPNNHRWMGDNAWLLIALNNYKDMTGDPQYDLLAAEIGNWLIGLQDADGGLFAGYGSDNTLLNYKVTEGNIDAFNAIAGYTSFHSSLLGFLEQDRWDDTDKNLVAWPGNPSYLYALDCHSWSYCLFEDYPVAALYSADRFLTTQTATLTNLQITGYDIDEDKDAVFLEGTGQMALAFQVAGLQSEADEYLDQMEKVLVPSSNFSDASGFPYASNIGTSYGNSPHWTGADTKIAISGGAWYLFAKSGFNPFAVGLQKNVPEADKFWLD